MTTAKRKPVAKLKGASSEFDVYLGRKVREAREMRNWSQEKLGSAIGVTFQQIQKYEIGENRMAIERFYLITTALVVPLPWFFEGLAAVAADAVPEAPNPDEHRQLMRLSRAFSKIKQDRVRRSLISMAESVVAS